MIEDRSIPERLRDRADAIDIPGHRDAQALFFQPDPAISSGRRLPRRTAGCVVLYHGGGNDRLFGFGYVIERLMAAGFAVLTGHLSGHGAGGSDLFAVDTVRARVDALLEAARRSCPPGSGRVFVLGQSLGGSFALDQVARGVHADKVITVSAPTSIPRHLELFKEVGCLLGAAAWRAMLYGGPLKALPAYRGFRRADFPVRVRPGAHYIKEFAQAVESLDLPARLASMPAHPAPPPLLLAHGTRDGVIPVEQAHELSAALGHRATLLEIPRLHHLDPLLDRPTVDAIVGVFRT